MGKIDRTFAKTLPWNTKSPSVQRSDYITPRGKTIFPEKNACHSKKKPFSFIIENVITLAPRQRDGIPFEKRTGVVAFYDIYLLTLGHQVVLVLEQGRAGRIAQLGGGPRKARSIAGVTPGAATPAGRSGGQQGAGAEVGKGEAELGDGGGLGVGLLAVVSADRQALQVLDKVHDGCFSHRPRSITWRCWHFLAGEKPEWQVRTGWTPKTKTNENTVHANVVAVDKKSRQKSVREKCNRQKMGTATVSSSPVRLTHCSLSLLCVCWSSSGEVVKASKSGEAEEDVFLHFFPFFAAERGG